MNDSCIFIHGLKSSGHGFKGNFFRAHIPGIKTPDFKPYKPSLTNSKILKLRMDQLYSILSEQDRWRIIGSSFGGLMGSLYTLKNPKKVKRLILLAPMLAVPELSPSKFNIIDIPVVVYHGKNDNVISIEPTKERAESLFSNLTYNVVDDDHMLHPTTESIDWTELLELEQEE
jgi:pimeloyl-ACP methyl ester carboxylesterase